MFLHPERRDCKAVAPLPPAELSQREAHFSWWHAHSICASRLGGFRWGSAATARSRLNATFDHTLIQFDEETGGNGRKRGSGGGAGGFHLEWAVAEVEHAVADDVAGGDGIHASADLFDGAGFAEDGDLF